jgi:hypothetical protein
VFFTRDKTGDDGYPVPDRDSCGIIAAFGPASAFAGLVKAQGVGRGATGSGVVDQLPDQPNPLNDLRYR